MVRMNCCRKLVKAAASRRSSRLTARPASKPVAGSLDKRHFQHKITRGRSAFCATALNYLLAAHIRVVRGCFLLSGSFCRVLDK